MKKKRLNKDLLDVAIGFIVFILIATLAGAIKNCSTRKEIDKDREQLLEMMEYHSSKGFSVAEFDGRISLKE